MINFKNLLKNDNENLCECVVCQKKVVLFAVHLKSGSHLPKKCFICFNENLLKMMELAFYFILKAVFVLNTFKCLPWLSGHLEKKAWLER